MLKRNLGLLTKSNTKHILYENYKKWLIFEPVAHFNNFIFNLIFNHWWAPFPGRVNWYLVVIFIVVYGEPLFTYKNLPRDTVTGPNGPGSIVPRFLMALKPLCCNKVVFLRGHLLRMPPDIPGGGVLGMSNWEETLGQTCWKSLHFWSGLGKPWHPHRGAGGSDQGEDWSGLPYWNCCRHDLDKWKKANGRPNNPEYILTWLHLNFDTSKIFLNSVIEVTNARFKNIKNASWIC